MNLENLDAFILADMSATTHNEPSPEKPLCFDDTDKLAGIDHSIEWSSVGEAHHQDLWDEIYIIARHMGDMGYN